MKKKLMNIKKINQELKFKDKKYIKYLYINLYYLDI